MAVTRSASAERPRKPEPRRRRHRHRAPPPFARPLPRALPPRGASATAAPRRCRRRSTCARRRPDVSASGRPRRRRTSSTSSPGRSRGCPCARRRGSSRWQTQPAAELRARPGWCHPGRPAARPPVAVGLGAAAAWRRGRRPPIATESSATRPSCASPRGRSRRASRATSGCTRRIRCAWRTGARNSDRSWGGVQGWGAGWCGGRGLGLSPAATAPDTGQRARAHLTLVHSCSGYPLCYSTTVFRSSFCIAPQPGWSPPHPSPFTPHRRNYPPSSLPLTIALLSAVVSLAAPLCRQEQRRKEAAI